MPGLIGGISGGYNSSTTNTNQTTKRILTPEQQASLGALSSYGLESLNDPNKAIEPLRTGAYDKINRNYDAAPQNLMDSAAARGASTSAPGVERMLKELDIQRYGQLAGAENHFAGMALQQQNQGATTLQQILAQLFEQNTTGTSKSSGWNISAGAGR